MKLFDTIEAVKFPEENMTFITCGGYLYYIYSPKSKWWRKHSNAGNDHLTVSNYPDVSREELVDAMTGVFPKKEARHDRAIPVIVHDRALIENCCDNVVGRKQSP